MIWDRGYLKNQWEKRVRRKTYERWREIPGGGEEDEGEDVQGEEGEEEGEEEVEGEEEGEEVGGAEDEEDQLLWINLTRTKVSIGAEIYY